MQLPGGPGVRCDGHVFAGQEITLHYDNLLLKVVVHDEDRPAAIQRLKRALFETRLPGVTTNIPFVLRVLDDPRFLSGDYDTSLAEDLPPRGRRPDDIVPVVAAALALHRRVPKAVMPAAGHPSRDLAAGSRPTAAGWTGEADARHEVLRRIAGRERLVEIQPGKDGLQVLVDGEPHPVDIAEVQGAGLYSLLVDGNSHAYAARFENGEATALLPRPRGARSASRTSAPGWHARPPGGARRGGGPAEIKSVMPGVVKEIRVAEGDRVAEGQPLLILEAMKMENEIRAPHEGVVERIHVQPGAAVDKGALLVTMGAAQTEAPAPAETA